MCVRVRTKVMTSEKIKRVFSFFLAQKNPFNRKPRQILFQNVHHRVARSLSLQSIFRGNIRCFVLIAYYCVCVLFNAAHLSIVRAKHKCGETMECKSNKNRQQIKSHMVQPTKQLNWRAIFWIPNENGKRSIERSMLSLFMCVRQRYMDERKFMVTSIVKHCMCRLHKIYVDFARLHGATLYIVLNMYSYVLFRSSFSHLLDVWWMNNNRRFTSGIYVSACVFKCARAFTYVVLPLLTGFATVGCSIVRRKLLWCKIYFS